MLELWIYYPVFSFLFPGTTGFLLIMWCCGGGGLVSADCDTAFLMLKWGVEAFQMVSGFFTKGIALYTVVELVYPHEEGSLGFPIPPFS